MTVIFSCAVVKITVQLDMIMSFVDIEVLLCDSMMIHEFWKCRNVSEVIMLKCSTSFAQGYLVRPFSLKREPFWSTCIIWETPRCQLFSHVLWFMKCLTFWWSVFRFASCQFSLFPVDIVSYDVSVLWVNIIYFLHQRVVTLCCLCFFVKIVLNVKVLILSTFKIHE